MMVWAVVALILIAAVMGVVADWALDVLARSQRKRWHR